uniref:Uncharacterized protein n=1 Tax=Anguilla anguilla TaxID=7936 RepID=A0A0E9R6P3_ANGAN
MVVIKISAYKKQNKNKNIH